MANAYEKVTRNMVVNLNKNFEDFKMEIKKEFTDMRAYNQKIYNHLSSRLPPWAVGVGGIGLAIISALVGAFLGRAI
jgi:hypothetical protein